MHHALRVGVRRGAAVEGVAENVRAVAAVEVIARQRTADGCHMDADLVRSAGLKAQLKHHHQW